MFPFTDFRQVRVVLVSLGKTCHEKQSKPSQFDNGLIKNSRTTHRVWDKSFSMIQSENWSPQSTNRLQKFSLLFLPETGFSDFYDKIKYV